MYHIKLLRSFLLGSVSPLGLGKAVLRPPVEERRWSILGDRGLSHFIGIWDPVSGELISARDLSGQSGSAAL